MDRKEIYKKLCEIDSKIYLITDFLLKINPNNSGFSFYALLTGLDFEEVEKIEKLFFEASTNKITIDDFYIKFSQQLPRRKDYLFSIAKALKSDKRFPKICNKIISEKILLNNRF